MQLLGFPISYLQCLLPCLRNRAVSCWDADEAIIVAFDNGKKSNYSPKDSSIIYQCLVAGNN